MASCADPAARGNFTFGQTVAGFLVSPGLPFVDILSEMLIARVFAKHHGGRGGRWGGTEEGATHLSIDAGVAEA
jgi:putative transposase